ncbi:hypothetical protein ASC59_11375 [Leifsonia sp. Root1293]|nr:hypothetical protein ASC59_11375 [Leifsonia sp. Root1293]KRA12533.1 hypothetical protein ASD61_11375 [Leifsonia sp. Root60]
MPRSIAAVVGVLLVATAVIVAIAGTALVAAGAEIAFLLVLVALPVFVTGIGALAVDAGRR